MSAVVGVTAVVSRLVLAVTPSPTPSPSATGSAATSLGSPGITGFVVTFVLAVALIGLFLSLTRHLRIVDRRSRQREEEAQDVSDAPVPQVETGDGAAEDVASDDASGAAGAGSR